MNFKTLAVLMIRSIVLLLVVSTANADGTVTDDIRITSDVLGYDLQYRIYLPEGYDSRADHPVIFLTDGQNYIRRGDMPRILNRLISDGKIEPVIAVFVDARDPDNLELNRRRTQFFCNVDYLQFYTDELIPTLEKNYPVVENREGRTIMGLSFGVPMLPVLACWVTLYFQGSQCNHPLTIHCRIFCQPMKRWQRYR